MKEEKYEHPLVTVVIATYNRADTLDYAIQSCMWQTFKNFEVWIVGDRCTDHTEQVVSKYLDDPRVNWYNLPKNSGYQSKPNNEGIKRAKGKYIAYLNHDDIWLPNHLEDNIRHIEATSADFVFSIMQWVYSFTYSQADIPLLPDLPRPPEATAVVHKKSVVDTIGYWKDIHETYAYPRTEFFRDAQKAKMTFEIVPSLTSLKFLWDEKNYHDVGPQPIYMERLRKEPDYVNKEMSQMLIRAYQELGRVPSFKRFKLQVSDMLRATLFKRNIDPARLKFWMGKGGQIRVWRKRHGLKETVANTEVSEPATAENPQTVKG
ncbi:glycosyl transferase [Fulvivirga imtechensis AK7]|uniref:Glycosyl transferase n=1 Tax=Fulvivirga imtechensis AK7 TaxID=1237149 RepID=L8JWU0_9BACT|nr:glycosyltransferase family A protein [Fulvivirga imtechensis]ELR71672.1 glycosyl transferase [Fulvivirga imtechensis AK7]